MEVRQLRIATLPVLIALFGFFALSVAASSGLSGAQLWTTASKDLLHPGLKLKYSSHGTLTQVSDGQQNDSKPVRIMSQGQNVINAVQSSMLNTQLDAAVSAGR